VVVIETTVDVDFPFQHFQIGAPKFFEVDYLYCVTLVQASNFHTLEDEAAEAFPQLVTGIIFVLAHAHLVLLETQGLDFVLLTCEGTGDALLALVNITMVVFRVISH
jgi:hypothetical protein